MTFRFQNWPCVEAGRRGPVAELRRARPRRAAGGLGPRRLDVAPRAEAGPLEGGLLFLRGDVFEVRSGKEKTKRREKTEGTMSTECPGHSC